MLGMCTKIDSDFRDYSDHLHPPPTIAPPPLLKKRSVALWKRCQKEQQQKPVLYSF